MKNEHICIVLSLLSVTAIPIYIITVATIMLWSISSIDVSCQEVGQARNLILSPRVMDLKDMEPKSEIVSLGTFEIYHYCPCEECCSKTDGITASGTVASEGRTIATDPSVIPTGSEVLIDGKWYIAEDVGGVIKGQKIDIFVEDHQEALNLGARTAEVQIRR